MKIKRKSSQPRAMNITQKQFSTEFRVRLDSVLKSGERDEVATYVGVTPSTISRWGRPNQRSKTGEHILPNIHDLERLAEVVDVNPEWLAFGRGLKSRDANNRITGLSYFQKAGLSAHQMVIINSLLDEFLGDGASAPSGMSAVQNDLCDQAEELARVPVERSRAGIEAAKSASPKSGDTQVHGGPSPSGKPGRGRKARGNASKP